jgi:hypothetical protein
MRKIIFSCVILLFSANLTFSLKNKSENLSAKNIEMLQVSAGEAGCSNESDKWCQISLVGVYYIQGVGTPYSTW